MIPVLLRAVAEVGAFSESTNLRLHMPVKQVIVIRKDLKMRRGKEIAQGSHASNQILEEVAFQGLNPSDQLIEWLNTGKTKICLQVNSEEELLKIYNDASDAGLTAYLIKDTGKTEFNGIPTHTCLAIGPESNEAIDPITKHLKTY